MSRQFRFSEAKARELVAANGSPADVVAFPNYANHYTGIVIRLNGQWQAEQLQKLYHHTQASAIEIKIGGMYLTCSEEVAS